ncbi:MAG: hypothetical protein IT370_19170 [Deltaproteobacteria bacterium]|nr:hypothetical protein [Deltaproteobacteria bacterium]
MSWQDDLEQLLMAYVADEGLDEGARCLAAESRWKPAFGDNVLAAIDQAITAAKAGDEAVALLLQRSLGGDREPLSEALSYLGEFKATFLAHLANPAKPPEA